MKQKFKNSVFEHCNPIPYPKRECIPEEEPDDKDAKNQQQQQHHQQQQQHQISLQQPPDKRIRLSGPPPVGNPANNQNSKPIFINLQEITIVIGSFNLLYYF